jgi:hypothetical protein
MRLALVIQGPVESFGRTGASIGDSTQQQNVKFDCNDNILRYVQEFKEDFKVILLSTWKGQNLDKLENLSDLYLVVDDDEATNLPRISTNEERAVNNKFRQYRSLLNGINFLEKMDIDLVVKVRTDQYVDARSLAMEASSNPHKFWTPLFYSGKPDYLEDFYMAGSPNNLKKLCEFILSGKSLKRSPHTDLFYSYILSKDPLHRRKRLFTYFRSRFQLNPVQHKFICDAWENQLDSFSSQIYALQIWRGQSISANAISTIPTEKFAPGLIARPVKGGYLLKQIDWKELLLYLIGLRGQIILQKIKLLH